MVRGEGSNATATLSFAPRAMNGNNAAAAASVDPHYPIMKKKKNL